MKKVNLINRALSCANYMTEEELMQIIRFIASSEESRDGLTFDDIVRKHLNDPQGFDKKYVVEAVKKQVYLQLGVPTYAKDYFIDNLFVEMLSDMSFGAVEFSLLHEKVESVMESFTHFIQE